MTGLTRLAALAGAAFAAAAVAGVTFAAFSGTTSNANSFSAKRVYSGSRTSSVWTVWDNSNGGAGITAADKWSYADAVLHTTGNWSSAYSATRYFQWELSSPLPAGLAVTGAQLNFRFAANAGGNTACYYLEVRRKSDDSLLGTHGDNSGSNHAGCVTGNTQTTTTVTLPEVSTTDIANDLRIRAYARESNNNRIRVDTATVSGSTPHTTFTLYETSALDAATGSGTAVNWTLAVADTTTFLTTGSNWPTAYLSTDWLRFTFPAMVPTGATITSVTLTYSYKSATSGPTTCHYFEVYAGVTLLASHGDSSGTNNVSCATTTFVTDSVSLPEVNTDTEANSIVIKDFLRNSGSNKPVIDLATITVVYHLD